jgi:hypothetical protein
MHARRASSYGHSDSELDGLIGVLLVSVALLAGAVVGLVLYVVDAAAWYYLLTLVPAVVIGLLCRLVFLIGSGVRV